MRIARATRLRAVRIGRVARATRIARTLRVRILRIARIAVAVAFVGLGVIAARVGPVEGFGPVGRGRAVDAGAREGQADRAGAVDQEEMLAPQLPALGAPAGGGRGEGE